MSLETAAQPAPSEGIANDVARLHALIEPDMFWSADDSEINSNDLDDLVTELAENLEPGQSEIFQISCAVLLPKRTVRAWIEGADGKESIEWEEIDPHAGSRLAVANEAVAAYEAEKAQPPAPMPAVCPTCGSDCNERDELTKAEREIDRLRKALADVVDTDWAFLRQDADTSTYDSLYSRVQRGRQALGTSS
ncbi:MAG: hypothetical protein IV107_11065 [Paucibacter sp.]|nr:hypothetical protein [Roseateles sp.]